MQSKANNKYKIKALQLSKTFIVLLITLRQKLYTNFKLFVLYQFYYFFGLKDPVFKFSVSSF